MLETLSPLTRTQQAIWSEGLVVITSEQCTFAQLASETVLAECRNDISAAVSSNAATFIVNSYCSESNPKLKVVGDQLFDEVTALLGEEPEQEFVLKCMAGLTYSRYAIDKSPHRDNFYGKRQGKRITLTLDNPGELGWEGEAKITTLNKNDLMVQELHDFKAKTHGVRRKNSELPRSIFFWDYVATETAE